MNTFQTNGPEAVISRAARSPLTSGRRGEGTWRLEFRPSSPPWIEPLMGWTASRDPMAHMGLTFPTREAAVRFAQRQRLRFIVQEPATTRHIPKPYADRIARLRQNAPATLRPAPASEPIQLPMAA